jgi:PKD repeat protein
LLSFRPFIQLQILDFQIDVDRIDFRGFTPGQPTSLEGVSVSSSDSNSVLSVQLDWGDWTGWHSGFVDQTTGEVEASHTFLSGGSYTVKLRVEDARGLEYGSKSAIIGGIFVQY